MKKRVQKWLLNIPLLLILGVVSMSFGQEDIINEQLRDGNLPAGWTAVEVGFSTSAGGYARFDDQADTTLTTPVVDLSTFTDVMLTFDVAKFGSGTNGPVTVEVSIDGGTTWTAQTFDSPTPTSGTYQTSGPTAITSSSAQTRFRFTRTNSPSQKRFRDVLLTGVNSGPADVPVITNIIQTPAADSVMDDDTVAVTADVTDDVAVATVVLNYFTSVDPTMQTINMTPPAMGSTYTTSADIPAQAEGVMVTYEIVATDADLPAANTTTSPPQTYTVLVDNPPVISNIVQDPTADNVLSSDTVNVSVDVVDDNDNVTFVDLRWGLSEASIGTNTISMTLDSGNTYTTMSTPIPAQENGTTVFYVIRTSDGPGPNTDSAVQSYTVSDPLSLSTELVQTFENEFPQWTYETSIPFFGDTGTPGYYGIFLASQISQLDNDGFINNILAENDLDDNNMGGGTSGFAVTTFNDVDITTNTGVILSFDYQIVGYNAGTDDAMYEVFYDDVSQGEVFLLDGFSAEDTSNDDASGKISINVPDVVNKISLKISIRDNGEDAYSGFDNIRLVDDTLPVAYTFSTANGWVPNDPSLATLATAMDDVVVQDGNATVAGGFNARDLIINSGASLTLATATTVVVERNLVNNGTFDALETLVEFSREDTHIISGSCPVDFGDVDLPFDSEVNIDNQTNIFGNITTTSLSEINTNGLLTFKSNTANTGTIGNTSNSMINGVVNIERFVPAKRSFRLLTSSVNTSTSINANWQNGEVNTMEGVNVNGMSGFGTQITGMGGDANGFDVTATNNPSMYEVIIGDDAGTPTPETAYYSPIANTNMTNLAAGKGYLTLVRGDRGTDLTTNTPSTTPTVLRATGTLVTGNVGITDPTILNPTANETSLVGNPFQSTIDVALVLSNGGTINIDEDFIHVFDASVGPRGAFVTVDVANNTNNTFTFTGPPEDPATGSMADRFIQPGQAFFVNTDFTEDIGNPGTVALAFAQDDKDNSEVDSDIFLTGNNTLLNETGLINVALFDAESYTQGNTLRDAFTVRFSENFSNDIASGDARKIPNLDESLASVVNGESLSIQSRFTPTESDEIAMSITSYREDNYVFRVNLRNMANVSTYLVDNYLDTQTLLGNDEETIISFSIVDGDMDSEASNRFKIVFAEEVLSNDDLNATNFAVYPNPVVDGRLNIAFGSSVGQVSTIEIFNILGQQVFLKDITTQSFSESINISKFESGVYIVKVIIDGQSTSQRIIIQ